MSKAALHYPEEYIDDISKDISLTILRETGSEISIENIKNLYDNIADKGRMLSYDEINRGMIKFSERAKSLPLNGMLNEVQEQFYQNRAKACKTGHSDQLCKDASRNLVFTVLVSNRLRAASTSLEAGEYPEKLNEGLLAYMLYKNYEPNKVSKLYNGMIGEIEESIAKIKRSMKSEPMFNYLSNLTSEETWGMAIGMVALGTAATTEILKSICKDGSCSSQHPTNSVNSTNDDWYQREQQCKSQKLSCLEECNGLSSRNPGQSTFSAAWWNDGPRQKCERQCYDNKCP